MNNTLSASTLTAIPVGIALSVFVSSFAVRSGAGLSCRDLGSVLLKFGSSRFTIFNNLIGKRMLPAPSTLIGLTRAHLAVTFSIAPLSCAFRVLMALVAMCPGALLRSASHCPFDSTRSVSAPHVLAWGNWLQVFGINATPNPAKMIQAQAFRNFANVQFIANNVGHFPALKVVRHDAISVVNASSEQPASAVRLRTHLLHQSLHRGPVAPSISSARACGRINPNDWVFRLMIQNAALPSSAGVFARTYGFEMRRINTTTRSARVVDPHASGNGSDVQFIRDHVRWPYAPVNVGKSSVAIYGARRPHPAPRFSVYRYLLAEPINQRSFNMVVSQLDLLKSFGQGCLNARNVLAARSYFTPKAQVTA